MPRLTIALALLAFMTAACGRSIGDSCQANVECDPQGRRFCDISTPNGYCTIDGCDVGTCPSEAVCVRFFTLQPNRACTYDPINPTGRGVADETGAYVCRADERCLCDGRDNTSGTCPTVAYCAPETTERRWCQRTCETSADCRENYECRSTGTLGAEPVPRTGDGAIVLDAAKFCAPKAR